MIHPLLRLVATQPHLLAEHAQAYGGLVGEEVGKAATALKLRMLLTAVALCLLVISAVLAGVALMLWAVLPSASILAPWALVAAPAIPAALAAWCWLESRRQPGAAFDDLKQQLAADLSLLREVSVP